MLWNVDDKGFLPSCDPLIQIPISNYKHTQLVFVLENLAFMMPCFLTERRWREEIVYELREVSSKFGNTLVDKLGSAAELERALVLFNMFANAYCFSYGDIHIQRLPKELSVPLAKAAKCCGRRPVLDYTSYILYNWQQNNDKIEALVTFTDTKLEKNLIEAFVCQEFDLVKMINNCTRTADSPAAYISKWKDTLASMLGRLRNLRNNLDSKEFEVLSEYYNGHNDCSIFAQSPIFSILYKMFSAVNKDPLLQKAESDICDCRPSAHNQFIANVNPIVSLIDQTTKLAYNECLQLFIDLHHEMFMIKNQKEWSTSRVHALEKCFI